MSKVPLLLATLLAALPATAQPSARSWDFDVLLDGKPIGSHRFTVTESGEERVMHTQAAFSVSFLGFVAYRYRHEATERWSGECLSSMEASTNDDGKANRVQARAETAGLRIKVDSIAVPVQPGCLMSFAYWNPALLARAPGRLVNSQNGRIETVAITRLADTQIELRGAPQAAQHWRITPAAPEMAPIDLWYSPQGEWLALESKVRGSRILHYRLR